MAITADIRLTSFRAPENKIEVGKCNHIVHQNKNKNAKSFLKKVKIMNEEVAKLYTELEIIAKESETKKLTEESVYMKIDEAIQGARQANIIDDIGLAYYKNG